jgi:hypothetical protein
MWSEEKLRLVRSRLDFIKELSEVKEHFRGTNKIIQVSDREWTHSYLQFSGLRIYLALTCFDILGQPDDWKDFSSWLKSKNHLGERSIIFAKYDNKNLSDAINAIHEEYLNIYGVKRSFFKFIREIISQNDHEKLLNSIKGQKRITETQYNRDGTTTLGTGIQIDPSDLQKEKFLFEIRNFFTHSGLPIGDAAAGLFNNEEPLILPDKEKPTWLFYGIHTQKIGNDYITFLVQRWPYVILEIIENTILKK